MKEFTLGDHASVFKGAGFNFVGIRDWEPGDRIASIDWAQSSLTNFSPMITREFEQDSNAAIVAVADASLSTRCGVARRDRSRPRSRAPWRRSGCRRCSSRIMFGLVTFDDASSSSPRRGRGSAARTCIYCLDLYQQPARHRHAQAGHATSSRRIESQLRKASLVPVISDFLFPDAERVHRELSLLNAVHDVFLLMADVRFAYELPRVSDGWIEAFDVETGRTRVLSRREIGPAGRARHRVAGRESSGMARDAGLDVVRVGLDRWEMETALVEFTAERRLRKMK